MDRYTLMENFINNMEIERVKLGLTQEQMAKKLDLSLSSYKRIVTFETQKVDLYTAYRLYELTGKLAYEFMGLTGPFLDLKQKISDLSESQLNYIDSLLDFEKDFAAKHSDSEDYVTVFIPTGNMEDGMIYDSSNVEKMNIAKERMRFKNKINCGIRITSNHLHPTYLKGDTLLICKEPIRDGDTGVFIDKLTGCAFIRKFYQTNPCRLEPVSEYGKTFYIDSENLKEMSRWIKFGYVISKVR